MTHNQTESSNWYALRTRKESASETALEELVDEVYVPLRRICSDDGHVALRPAIPRLLFFKAPHDTALRLERESQTSARPGLPPFWIYRYLNGGDIQTITQREIDLMRLLTADDCSRCEIFNKTDFRRGDSVRVSAGPFRGYTGHVVRIRKNLHVVVEIEGICSIALPFIHPDLLEKI